MSICEFSYKFPFEFGRGLVWERIGFDPGVTVNVACFLVQLLRLSSGGWGSAEGSDVLVQAEGREQPLAQCARG